MLKVTTEITYKIPPNEYCNNFDGTMCRFVVPDGDIHMRCVLHDEQLTASQGNVRKCDSCMECRRSRQCKIEDRDTILDEKSLIKLTTTEFTRLYKSLRAKRYSEEMALAIAKEQVNNPDYLL